MEGDTGVAILYTYFYDTDGNYITSSSTYKKDNADWAQSIRTVEAPEGATSYRVRLIHYGDTIAGSTEDHSKVAIRNIQVQNLGQPYSYAQASGGESPTKNNTLFAAPDNFPVEIQRYVYDDDKNLRFAISAEGNVSEFRYDDRGNLTYQIGYPSSGLEIGSTIPTLTSMEDWAANIADTSDLQITRHEYDISTSQGGRGQITKSTEFSLAADADIENAANRAGGYKETYYTYDHAGQLLNTATPNAGSEHFVYDGLGRIISSTDASGLVTNILFHDAATTTKINLSTGYIQASVYNLAGDLVSQSDVETNDNNLQTGQSEYKYDTAGRLRWMQDAFGTERFYTYDLAGRKTADVTGAGGVTEYKYDNVGRIVATVKYHNTLSGAELTTIRNDEDYVSTAQFRPTANNSYDIWNWTVYDDAGKVAQTISGNGTFVTYTYDSSDRLISSYQHNGTLTAGAINGFRAAAPTELQTRDVNSADIVDRIFFDNDGRALANLNGDGYLTRTVFDQAGRALSVTTYANEASPAIRQTGTLDQIIASVTLDSAKDQTVRYVYNGQSQLRFTIDAEGYITEFNYGEADDASGAVRQTVTYVTAPSLNAYDYDSVKIAVAALASNAENRITRNIYNENLQLSFTISARGEVTQTLYDVDGRMKKTVAYGALYTAGDLPTAGAMDTWASANDADTRITRFYHNSRGELNFTLDAEGYVHETIYNESGQVEQEISWSKQYRNLDSNKDNWSIASIAGLNKGTFVSRLNGYDAAGRLNSITDEEGVETYITYFGNGQVDKQYMAYGSVEEQRITASVYDVSGRLRATTEAYGTSVARATFYEYDAFNNVTKITEAGSKVTQFSHDSRGNVLVQTDAEQVVTEFNYDAFGNVSDMTEAKGLTSERLTEYEYDRRSSLTKETTPDEAETDFEYNAFGDLRLQSRPEDRITGFTYDSRGNVLTQTDGEQGVTVFAYNNFGQLLTQTDAEGGVTTSYYNKLGQLTRTVNAENYVVDNSYKAFGQIETITSYYTKAPANVTAASTIAAHANDATTHFYYDKVGRLTSVMDARGETESYTLNDHGQRDVFINKLGGTTEYEYDALGQMIEEKIISTDATVSPTITNKFQYDSRGNLKIKTEGYGSDEVRTTEYFYDLLDRVKETKSDAVDVVTSTTGAIQSGVIPIQSYEYDDFGNMIESEDANGARTLYFYDEMDRVTHTVSPLGTLAENDYDDNSNLIETRVYEKRLTTIPNNALGAPPTSNETFRRTTFDYDNLNRMTDSYVHDVKTASFDGTLSISSQTGNNLHTQYEYDAIGSVILVTDPSGGQTYSYYDDLGRKTHQIDAEGYMTAWVYDANGNVTQETKYGSKPTGTISTSSYGTIISTFPAESAAAALLQENPDRITNYTYDENGNRKSETRQNVLDLLH